MVDLEELASDAAASEEPVLDEVVLDEVDLDVVDLEEPVLDAAGVAEVVDSLYEEDLVGVGPAGEVDGDGEDVAGGAVDTGDVAGGLELL